MAFRSAFTVLVLFVLTLQPLKGQAKREPRLVNVNVIALDGHGQPVDDLTEDDFAVSDAGRPQKIVFFRHNDSNLPAAPALAANEFSNRSGANIPHATVILFDMLNESFGSRGFARAQLERYLESLENADYLYLYLLTLDGRLVPVHGLPVGSEEIRLSRTLPWTRQIRLIMDDAINAVAGLRPVGIDVAVRVPLTYRALDALSLELARIPGRKSCVWITDGVPIVLGPLRSDTGDFVDFTPYLRQLSEALERSGIAIYPVRQIMLGSPNGVDGVFGEGIGSEETLDEFAGMTGGRPNSGKDIGAAVKQAMQDLRTGYHIGYYPSLSGWDDKLHKLRVTTTRKGVHLQTKTGYYAWAEPAGDETRQAIDSLISTTFDAAEIGLRAGISRDRQNPGVARLELHIEATDIVLAHERNQYTGELRIAVIGYSTDGGKQSSPILPLNVNYSSHQRDEILNRGIDFAQDLALEGKVARIRIIVYDRGSNAAGSVTIPITSKAPNRSQ